MKRSERIPAAVSCPVVDFASTPTPLTKEKMIDLIAKLRLLCPCERKAYRISSLGWYTWMDEFDIVHFQPHFFFREQWPKCNYGFRYFEEGGFVRYYLNELMQKKTKRGIPQIIVQYIDEILEGLDVGLTLSNHQLDQLFQTLLWYLKKGDGTVFQNFHCAPDTQNTVELNGSVLTIRIRNAFWGYLAGYQYHFEPHEFPENLKLKSLRKVPRDDDEPSSEATAAEIEDFITNRRGEFYAELERMALQLLKMMGPVYAEIYDDDVCIVHRQYLHFFPFEIAYLFLTLNKQYTMFMKTDWTTEPGFGDGVTREFIHLLGKSLFGKPTQQVTTQDGFPYFTIDDPTKKQMSAGIIWTLFNSCHSTQTRRIGNVLSPSLFEAMERYKELPDPDKPPRFEFHECLEDDSIPSHKYYQYALDFPMETSEYHRKALDFVKKYIDFSGAHVKRGGVVTFRRDRGEFEESVKEIMTILDFCGFDSEEMRGENLDAGNIFYIVMHLMVLQRIEKFIEFIHCLWFTRKRLGQMQYVAAESVMGRAFNREEIANGISLKEDSNTTPYLRTCLLDLKNHILDESTAREWVENFLVSVTGSSNSGNSILIVGSALAVLPHSQTCFQTLEVSNAPHGGKTFLQWMDFFVQHSLGSYTDQ